MFGLAGLSISQTKINKNKNSNKIPIRYLRLSFQIQIIWLSFKPYVTHHSIDYFQKRRYGVIPTVDEIHSDVLTNLANQFWAPHSKIFKQPFTEKIIERIYYKEIGHK